MFYFVNVVTQPKPIYPPKGMPQRFRWREKEFHWYRTLKRGKKHYMIRIYRTYPNEIESVLESKILLPEKHIFGLLFIIWHPRSGPQPFGQYPTSFSLPQSVLLQVYGNHLASPESQFQQFSNGNDYYSSVNVQTPDEIPLYLIIHSTETEISFSLETTLIKFANLIAEKPSLIFEMGKATSLSIDPADLHDWVENFQVRSSFLKRIYQRVKEM